MLRYILWRIAVMIPTLIVISMLVFTIIQLPPGDFFESQIAELRAQGETANLQEIEIFVTNTASISLCRFNMSIGLPECCTAISAIPSNISCRFRMSSATACG